MTARLPFEVSLANRLYGSVLCHRSPRQWCVVGAILAAIQLAMFAIMTQLFKVPFERWSEPIAETSGEGAFVLILFIVFQGGVTAVVLVPFLSLYFSRPLKPPGGRFFLTRGWTRDEILGATADGIDRTCIISIPAAFFVFGFHLALTWVWLRQVAVTDVARSGMEHVFWPYAQAIACAGPPLLVLWRAEVYNNITRATELRTPAPRVGSGDKIIAALVIVLVAYAALGALLRLVSPLWAGTLQPVAQAFWCVVIFLLSLALIGAASAPLWRNLARTRLMGIGTRRHPSHERHPPPRGAGRPRSRPVS